MLAFIAYAAYVSIDRAGLSTAPCSTPAICLLLCFTFSQVLGMLRTDGVLIQVG